MTDHTGPPADPATGHPGDGGQSGSAGRWANADKQRPGVSAWLLGPDATPVEASLAGLAVLAGLAAVGWYARDLGWSWWQGLLAAVLVVDLAGGVVANGLDSVKRFYHGAAPPNPRATGRFLRHPVGFAAVHVQPVLIGALFPGGRWWWGITWYAVALAGTVLVHRLPAHLARPAALLVVTGSVFTAPLIAGPAGFWWLPAVLTLKLVLAHAVPDRPHPVPAR